MVKEILHSSTSKIDAIIADLYNYLENNALLIIVLAIVTLVSYGYELFNLNLTIDEEVAAVQSGSNVLWISQGRWGMYILNKFLLPYNVVPFIPLFIALIFQLSAILLIINSLEIKGKLNQIIIGAIFISFPGIAYIYTFSTINYGVGIGFFCVALSLFIYVKNEGNRKFWAVIPAVYAISIYQGFIPVLFSVFLLYVIIIWRQTDTQKIKTLIEISFIILFSIFLYYLLLKLIMTVGRIPTTGYVDQYFDIGFLRDNFKLVLTNLASIIYRVYSGDKSIYGIEVTTLGILLVVLSLGVFVSVLQSKKTITIKVLLLLFSIGFLFTPFMSGMLTRGYLAMRFLVGLPIVISGWVILGMTNNMRIYRFFVMLLAGFCVFQFATSTNHLFASSNLSLEIDRLLGSQLIERIEDAQAESTLDNIKYMEMIGYVDRPSTDLIPKSETFGASFFEWDQGNVARVLLFLQTLGYNDLQPLPLNLRGQMIEIANTMPIWPERGSVRLVGDTVLVKFGPYSYAQRSSICQSIENRNIINLSDFCP